jgi:uncharacterized short protein YbdD (DUF466 family)
MNRAAFAETWQRCVTIARRIAGIPDYEAYVAHLRRHHPEQTPPSRESFLRARLAARYGASGGRCC